MTTNFSDPNAWQCWRVSKYLGALDFASYCAQAGQGTETLINTLVELNKPFSLMVYPNRTHAISEGENTTRHLFETLTRFLTEKLPPGPR